MPEALDWETTITGDSGGETLQIEGVIYQPNGKAPARDVILYVYQTDATGLYAPAPDQTGARRHGRLRGWMKTGPDGRYRFRTIRPAPYPKASIPAHIHPIIQEPGKNEYYLDDYRFEDDPLLTEKQRASEEGRGGSGIISLTKGPDGAWTGRRDLVLGRNIPNYR